MRSLLRHTATCSHERTGRLVAMELGLVRVSPKADPVLGGHDVSGPGQLVAWTGMRRQRRGQPTVACAVR
jgi:hypothetical protein